MLVLLLTAIGLPLYAAEPGIVRFVYMQDTPPSCWSENGRPMGLQPEIAEQVAARLGLKAEHSFYPWARANDMIGTGVADVFITTPTPARFAFAAFGKGKAIIQKWSLFTHRDNAGLIAKAKHFTRLEELKPYALLDHRGNGWTASNLQGEYRIQQVTSIEQVLRMLALKRGDFTIANPAQVRWWAAKTGIGKELVEIPTQLPNTQFHFVLMVSRKSPWLQKGLVKGLDTALKEMKKSGEWARVTKKYGFPLETGTFKSQIQTDQFYVEYSNYPEFTPK